jgi:hypothetical protein
MENYPMRNTIKRFAMKYNYNDYIDLSVYSSRRLFRLPYFKQATQQINKYDDKVPDNDKHVIVDNKTLEEIECTDNLYKNCIIQNMINLPLIEEHKKYSNTFDISIINANKSFNETQEKYLRQLEKLIDEPKFERHEVLYNFEKENIELFKCCYSVPNTNIIYLLSDIGNYYKLVVDDGDSTSPKILINDLSASSSPSKYKFKHMFNIVDFLLEKKNVSLFYINIPSVSHFLKHEQLTEAIFGDYLFIIQAKNKLKIENDNVKPKDFEVFAINFKNKKEHIHQFIINYNAIKLDKSDYNKFHYPFNGDYRNIEFFLVGKYLILNFINYLVMFENDETEGLKKTNINFSLNYDFHKTINLIKYFPDLNLYILIERNGIYCGYNLNNLYNIIQLSEIGMEEGCNFYIHDNIYADNVDLEYIIVFFGNYICKFKVEDVYKCITEPSHNFIKYKITKLENKLFVSIGKTKNYLIASTNNNTLITSKDGENWTNIGVADTFYKIEKLMVVGGNNIILIYDKKIVILKEVSDDNNNNNAEIVATTSPTELLDIEKLTKGLSKSDKLKIITKLVAELTK